MTSAEIPHLPAEQDIPSFSEKDSLPIFTPLPSITPSRWSRCISLLFTLSLILLALLIGGCLSIGGYDIIFQAAQNHDYERIVVLGLTYVLMGFIAAIISIGRLLWVRRARQAIPPSHMPLHTSQIPKRSLEHIETTLDRSVAIQTLGQPRPSDADHPGWGRSDSPLANIHLKSSFLSTLPMISAAIERQCPACAHVPTLPPRLWLARLLQHQAQAPHVHPLDSRIAMAWLALWEQARWSRATDLSEATYIRGMKLTTLMLSSLKYQ